MELHLVLAFDPTVLATLDTPADIVVFPELVTGGYATLRATGRYVRPADPEVRLFRDFSQRVGATCIAGSLPLAGTDGSRTNTSLVFQNGRRIHRYDKIHLFPPAGDDQLFTVGKTMGTFGVGGHPARFRAGVVICYDLRFPELVRFLARGGMDIMFVPARWPAERDDAWQTLLKARAIENQMYVAGCNAPDEEGGASYVFGPGGEQVFSTRDVPAAPFHRITIDMARVGESRGRICYVDDARVLRDMTVPRAFRSR